MEASQVHFFGCVEDALSFVRVHEERTNSHFVIVRSPKTVTADPKQRKIFFEEPRQSGALSFSGIPFIINSSTVLACQHGRDRHVANKKKHEDIQLCAVSDHPINRKRKLTVQKTKKKNCEAKITIREIKRFPGFKIEIDTQKRRLGASRRLKKALLAGESVVCETSAVLLLDDTHSNHSLGEAAVATLPVDFRVKDYIKQLVIDGVRNIEEIRSYTETFVKETIFVDTTTIPSRFNRRFFPFHRDYENIVFRTRAALKKSCIDQGNMKKMKSVLKADRPCDNVIFGSYIDNNEKESTAIEATTSRSSEMSFVVELDKVQSVFEGRAHVDLPKSVFYNPVQEFNRDLTIAVIQSIISVLSEKTSNSCSTKKDLASDANETSQNGADINKSGHSKELQQQGQSCEVLASESIDQGGSTKNHIVASEKGIRILEGLSASGLRSVRFALEIPGIREVVANDYDRTAFEFIRHNAEKNGVSHLVTPSCMDAAMVMYTNRRFANRFDVIDLDPYGSPAPYLDAAVQSIADGGVICVTCTDMAVLCGNAAETCFAKYGAVSLRTPFCHEMALRIILQSIASHAARYQRYIEPLLSLSVDFYVRLFVRVRTGQSRVKDLPTQLSNVYHCRRCGVFTLHPLMTKNKHMYVAASGPPVGPQCDVCGGRHVIAGPIWSDPIHDKSFVQRIYENVSKEGGLFPSTRERIMGVLSVVQEELPDCPLYHVSDELCGIVHCVSPGFLPFRSALLHAGYQVSLSHAKKNSIKTNAPANVIWDIIRCWVLSHPVNDNRLKPGSAAVLILAKPPALQANFDLHPDANPKSRTSGLVRWQINPDKDWGPKPRAARLGNADDSLQDRRAKGEQRAEMVRKRRKRDLKKFPCKRFHEGLCDLGENCRYSHEEDSESRMCVDTGTS